MPAPTTSDEFLTLLGQSGLLPQDRLARLLDQVAPGDRTVTPLDLARRMVADGTLTPFQGQQLLAGRHKGFFVSGKYKLLAQLGSGGMGVVYLCEHLMLHRLVAVKALRPLAGNGSAGALERFYREARAVAQLDHPNIARLFDVDRSGQHPYMVMEYIDGVNLHTLVAEHGRLDPTRAAGYVAQAAAGLDHAHRAGLVHRDVKPGNLMVARDGTLKLLDLGLARFQTDTGRNENLTARFDDKHLIGTADFIAPEQTLDSSAVDPRADVYGLGCTLYFLLAGEAPFQDGTVTQKLLWHQLRTPKPIAAVRPDVPAELSAVLDRMLAKAREDRHQSAKELLADLAPWRAAAVEPPAAHELPRRSGSSFRLGLVSSAPPDGSNTHGILQTATAAPLPNDSRMTPVPSLSPGSNPTYSAPARSNPSRPDVAPDTAPVSANETEKTPRSAPPAPARPVRRWVVFGGVQLAILAAGLAAVWFLNQKSQVPTVTPPHRTGTPVAILSEFQAGGSTFVKKLVDQWSADYKLKEGIEVKYAGVGSSAGIKGLMAAEFDFACSDAVLPDKELNDAKAKGEPYIHVPLAMGAVVAAYNLPDVGAPLRFSGPVLADIYLGKITRWNDPAVRAENKQASLPDQEIKVVYRSDGSGTTSIWTEFLTKTSPAWAAKMGTGTTFPAWPVGAGYPKNDGVADAVGRTPYAIGYVELTFALSREKLSFGPVKNRAGRYVSPSLAAVTEAARNSLVPSDLRFSLTDPPGENSYPISGTAWAIYPLKPPADDDAARKRDAVLDFFWWATHQGQQQAPQNNYAPLPENVVLIVEATLQRQRRNSSDNR